jgi:hypothetical protein
MGVLDMINPDIDKAIQVIDSKIEELQKAKKILMDLFGSNINNFKASISSQSQISRPNLVVRRASPTRKEALIKLLQDEGPLSRSEIFKRSGMPKGTVAYLLNNRDIFFAKNGRWHLVEKGTDETEEKEKGLTPEPVRP